MEGWSGIKEFDPWPTIIKGGSRGWGRGILLLTNFICIYHHLCIFL